MDISDCQILKKSSKKSDMIFKVVLIGSASVGKSCIFLRATENAFTDSYNVTVGTDMRSLQVKIKDKIIELQIWDTAGMEQFRSMIKVFFKGANSVFLVYDITRKETFSATESWLQMIQDTAPTDVRVILIGNKKDDEKLREVSEEEAKSFARMMRIFDFKETSAKTGEGIIETLKCVAKQLYMDTDNVAVKVKPEITNRLKKPQVQKKKCC